MIILILTIALNQLINSHLLISYLLFFLLVKFPLRDISFDNFKVLINLKPAMQLSEPRT